MSAAGPIRVLHIADRPVGDGAPPFVIAEMACAHQGQIERALAIVDAAADAGADAVQFEIFDAPNNMVGHAPLYELITRLQFAPAQWRSLYEHARRRSLAVIGYAYDPPSLALALELGSDALKLNASDLCHPAMVRGVAASGLPYTLGTGAATLDEIAGALATAYAAGGAQVVLMHGVQSFPTRLEDAWVRRLRLLADAFGCLVGYADHTEATDPLARSIELLALGAGACVIEKHIALERRAGDIDIVSALEPAEFADFARTLRRAAAALGSTFLRPGGPAEERYRRFQRKMLVAACDIAAGAEIRPDMLAALRHVRPGLAPTEAGQLIGRRAARAIARHEPVLPEALLAPEGGDGP